VSPASGASVADPPHTAVLTGGRDTAAAAVILGAALTGVVFGAAGGTELTRTTSVELLMVLLGGAVVAAAVAWGRRGPVHGGTAVVLFVALAVLTALSVTWAIVPSIAYVEANRTFAYLAVFTAAVGAARLAPRGAPAVIGGVVLAAIATSTYALLGRVWPASIGDNEISNRIGQPFEYWNAVGTTAALAIPGLLWLASRRGGPAAPRVLAYPAMGVAILAILLTQSRGALAAAVLGTIAWFAIVPLRLRALPVLVAGSIGAGGVAAWALSKDPFSVAAQPLAAKESVAGDFGLLLLLMVVLLTLVGLAVGVGFSRVVPSMRARRRIGIAALAIACAIPLVALTSVAFSDRGLGGTIDDRVDELTSETDTAPTQGSRRFAAAESTRGKYWREADRVFDDRPWIGTGAGTFRVARLRHRTDDTVTGHAHGFVPQTMADLGIVGLIVTTGLLLAWLVAVARTTALYPRRLPVLSRDKGEPPARRDWTADRIALVSLTLIAVVFGLQSLIDWTWFIPGPTAMALVAGGYVAGRGPAAAVDERPALEALRERFSQSAPPRLIAAAGVLLAALLCAWAVWQPESSDRATGDALALADQGDYDAAIAKADDAADTNPLSAEPYLVKAAIETQAGQETAAERTLEDAVLKFPGEPQNWYRLAAFQLGTVDRPVDAAGTIQGALYLDPFSASARQLFLDARARAREKAAEESTP
jgi:O-antigen ligase